MRTLKSYQNFENNNVDLTPANDAINMIAIQTWFDSLSLSEQQKMSLEYLGHGNADMLDNKDMVIIYINEHEI